MTYDFMISFRLFRFAPRTHADVDAGGREYAFGYGHAQLVERPRLEIERRRGG